MIEWIAANSVAVQAVAAAIAAMASVTLIAVTAWYARLTSRIATTSRRQAFEAGFFQLLSAHRLTTESVKTSFALNAPRGRYAIDSAASGIVGALSDLLRENPTAENLAAIDAQYRTYCEAPGSDFGFYFRSLYYLLSFVDTSDLDPRDKVRYASLVQAQLSTTELTLILYNVLSTKGTSEFRSLIGRFGILQDMPFAHPLIEEHFKLLPHETLERAD